MKIESINTTALEAVLVAAFGPEAANGITQLYALTNDAMHAGYVAGYEEGNKTGFERGYAAAENAEADAEFDAMFMSEFAKYADVPSDGAIYQAVSDKLYANCAALDKEYKRLDEAYADFYENSVALDGDRWYSTDDVELPDYIGDYYIKR
jgi:hypothetical protein